MLTVAIAHAVVILSDVPRPKSVLGHHPGRPTPEEALLLPSRNRKDYYLASGVERYVVMGTLFPDVSR